MGGTSLCRSGLRAWRRSAAVGRRLARNTRGHRRAAKKPAAGAALALAFTVAALSVGVAPASAVVFNSTVSVSLTPAPSVTGQSVSVCATVTGEIPRGATVTGPTGTVTFTGPGVSQTVGVDASSQACFTTTGLSNGFLSALYSGDSDYSSATGNALVSVGPADTTTTVTASPNPSVSAQAVDVCAVISVDAPGTGTPTGTVTFTGPGGLNATATLDGTGKGCTTTTTLQSGTATATYGGDSGYSGSTGTVVVTVNSADTTTTVTASPDPSVVGDSVQVCAAVAVASPGSGTPTGTVTFTGPGGLNQTVTLDGTGQACFTSTSLTSGTITATYSGDANYSASTGTVVVTVNLASTSTSVTATPNPSVIGQSVTVCATVGPPTRKATAPTGSVTFTGPSGLNQTVTLDGTGQACFTSTSLTSETITATYGGDASFATSTGFVSVTVSPPAATLTSVTATPDPSVIGETVQICATVTVDERLVIIPTGTVTITGPGGLNETVPLDKSGEGCTTSTTLASGTVTAAYSGDIGFETSTGTVPVTVNPMDTTTMVTATPDPSVTGQSVTVCAGVTAGLGLRAVAVRGPRVPAGTVTFAGPGGLSATVPLDSSGEGCTTSMTLASGTVTAAYSGDAGFAASMGTAVVTVNPADTTTTVTPTPDPSMEGQSVAICAAVAAVSPGDGIPTGTVTFTGPGGLNETATLGGTGEGCATSTTLTSGTVTAIYNGDGGFATSTGTVTVIVNSPSATVTSVTASPNPSVIGESVTICATVTLILRNGGAPTGTVTITGPAGLNDTVTLDNSGEGCTSKSLASGTVTATYNGDIGFETSTGTASVTVNPRSTLTTVTATPDPSMAGESVMICATVDEFEPGLRGVKAPRAIFPTGEVTFTGPGGLNETVALVSGQSCTTSTTLTSGTIVAGYSGDASFATSTGTYAVTVNLVDTTTTVTARPDPSVVGQSVTVCGTVGGNVGLRMRGAGTPTGSVTFTGPGGLNQTVTLDGNGQACFSSTSLVSGVITAVYSGDEQFATSTGDVTMTVNPAAATTTSVTATPNPSVIGQSVTVCATVAVDARAPAGPTGTVTFTGPGGLNQTVTLVSSQACLNTTTLTTGTVTAVYSGELRFAASTGTATVTVNPAPTTTVLTAARTDNSVELCATVTLTSTMTSFLARASGAPSGTVTFAGLTGLNQVATLDSNGQVCITVTDVNGGTATATYNGGNGFAGSADTATVTAAPPPVVASAPRNVTVVPGVTQIVVSWDPPATGPAVTGYIVTASPGPATCTTTGETSCVLGAIAGTAYTVTVVAVYADGVSSVSEPTDAASPLAVTPPATPPDTDLTLTTDQGKITSATPGQQIVFIGTGFLPYSTVVVSIYSDPIVLGTGITNAVGDFQIPITVPAGLSLGDHVVIAQGVAPDGTARAMAITLVISATGVVVGVVLPITGPSITLLLIGIVLAVAGTSLVTGSRLRRRRRMP